MNSKKTVLIIDDSKAFAYSLASLIRSEALFEVLIAKSFQEAQQILAQRAPDIFVSVSDLNLPDATDGDTIMLLKTYDIPCITFTGMFNNALREDIYSLGVCDYVLKQGIHDLTYVARLVKRIHQNENTLALVVDDSQSARDTMTQLLRSQRMKVQSAASGEEALAILKQQPDIDLILLDLVMEGSDGLSVLKQIRNDHDATELAVIGVSGLSSREQLAKFLKYGGNDFILKPIQEEEFFCRVNNVLQTLDQFSKLNELNNSRKQLISMAAHDIRSPIGAVSTAISLAMRRSHDEKVTKLLTTASKGCQTVVEMLDSLLDLSELEQTKFTLKIKKFQLGSLITEIVEEVSLWADEKQQTIELNIDPDTLDITADRIRIREVVANLLSNAIKYSPLKSHIKIEVLKQFNEVKLQVINYGKVIPEAEQKKLFQPFARLSSTPTAGESSTGLGLSICKKIVEQHRGKIQYIPKGDSISIFEVILPIHYQEKTELDPFDTTPGT